jgi:hypothetical protein
MNVEHSFRRARHRVEDFATEEGRVLMRNVGLVSAGITVLAVGLVVGRELRARYKFQRRTPYDFYAHAGDQTPEMEFGVGI